MAVEWLLTPCCQGFMAVSHQVLEISSITASWSLKSVRIERGSLSMGKTLSS